MRINVIGGGIGGLTAAIALARNGHDVAVYEQAPAFEEVGAGLSLWPNAVKVLIALGLGDALRRHACPLPDVAIRSRRGTVLTGSSADRLARLCGAPGYVILRAALVDLLAAELGAERVRLGVRCIGVASVRNRAVARVDGGGEIEGDLVVGADGIRSVVRAAVDPGVGPENSGYFALRGVAAFTPGAGEARWGETFGRGARFGLLPLGDGQVYWWLTLNGAAGHLSGGAAKAAALRAIAGWHIPLRAVVEATSAAAILIDDIAELPSLARWSRGHAVLIGDAAHAMTPNLGQGACQAIEDAYVLARCLRQESDIGRAFARYEYSRRPRVARVRKLARRIGRIGQISSPLLCAIRDGIARATPARLVNALLIDVARYDA